MEVYDYEWPRSKIKLTPFGHHAHHAFWHQPEQVYVGTNMRIEGEPEPEWDMNSTVSSAPDDVRVQALWMLVDAKNQRIDMLERMIDGAGYDVPDDDIIN